MKMFLSDLIMGLIGGNALIWVIRVAYGLQTASYGIKLRRRLLKLQACDIFY